MARSRAATLGALAAIAFAAAAAPAPAYAGDLLAFAAGAPHRISVKSIKERKFATVVRQQFDFSCGSAAVATLLTHHYGRVTSEQDAFLAMWDVGDQARIKEVGFSLLEMKRFVESIGLRADGFVLSLERVAEIAIPGVALIDEDGYRHFVVIKGVAGGKILVGDPARGLRTMSQKRFNALWDGTILFVRSDVEKGKANFNHARDWALTPNGPAQRALDGEPLQAAHLAQTRAFNSGFSVLATGAPIN
jgi:predicted double-glycine peptidase